MSTLPTRHDNSARTPARDKSPGTPTAIAHPLPLRPELQDLTAYGAPQLDVAVRLNTNENPWPPPPALVADLSSAVAAAAAGLHRYPDREATELRTALAGYLGIDVAQVWAANGSNEVLQQILQAFGGAGRRVMGFEPSYSMHRLIALATGTGWVAGRRSADFSLAADDAARQVAEQRPDVVFLCSPNNPTGTAMGPDVVRAVYDTTPGIVVVDEAYAEFSHGPSLLPLLAGRERLVVTRTMSKAFAFAGARVGYLAADPALVEALRLVRLPYHLSSLTQVAALAALRHASATLASVALVMEQRDRLVREVRGMGLEVVPSDANFVLFGRFADQHSRWDALLARGVLVRDVGLPGWLRVTAGLPAEVDAFLAAMEDLR